MLTTMTFNLVNTAIRRETLHGRQYIVAPLAMLTEGVHAGSNGPLLYKEAECKRAVPAWNMKPIVVYHPQINGQGVSACDPDILERQQVGMLMNTRWAGKKLRAEAWIDEERAGKVDDRVIDALEHNKLMEVSTGLFTDNVGGAGEWNGEKYTAEATNHQPDHLALLPDQIGACSIADGAGLLQLNEAATGAGVDITRLMAREMDAMRRMVGNAMSHSNVFQGIAAALRKKFGDAGAWVVDVYDTFFVYEVNKDAKLYRLGYTTGADAGVEITGEPEEVIRVTEYRTAKGDFVGNQNAKEKDTMTKKQIVDGIIANSGMRWVEGDREALMNMDETMLEKMLPETTQSTQTAPAAPTTDTAAPTTDTAAPQAPVTMAEYVNNAPAELRDVLTNALATHNAAKDECIRKITANKNNKFTPEFLATKGLQELQALAELATAGGAGVSAATVPMFTGMATPGAPVYNTGHVEKPLLMPTITFGNEG